MLMMYLCFFFVLVGGQAIGANGEVLARGGGNGAYSGIQSATQGTGTQCSVVWCGVWCGDIVVVIISLS